MDNERMLQIVNDENERLRERVAMLESALMATRALPLEWRLTSSEARVFGVLVNREVATKDAIMAALYVDDGRDEAEIKIVDVFICKIRKKLKPFGVSITTDWGQGYRLDAAVRADWRIAENPPPKSRALA